MITGRLQAKSNHWYCILNLHHPDGSRQQKWVSTGLKLKGNKRKAEKILLDLQREHATMCSVEKNSSGVYFADYMVAWLNHHKANLARTTFCAYQDILVGHIIPYFQSRAILLVALKPTDIEDYYQFLFEKGLSSNTVLHHHANIHKALKEAQKRELIASNPASLVERPQKKKFVPEPYSAEETRKLLLCVRGETIELPVFLAAFYGLRRSEIVGLRWKDIDFEKSTIMIRHSLHRRSVMGIPTTIAHNTLKRNASFRTLPLIPEILRVLQKHRQYAGTKANRDAYICRMKDGAIMKPAYISARFSKVLAKNGLRHVRFHDLRHGCASMLISERVPLIEVQQWLGHSTISTTADMYAHLDYSMKERSATTLAKQLRLGDETRYRYDANEE